MNFDLKTIPVVKNVAQRIMGSQVTSGLEIQKTDAKNRVKPLFFNLTILIHTRWAPSTYKWGYNPYE